MNPTQKTFKPKFPELCKMADYKFVDDRQFWAKFPKNYQCPAAPSINHVKLEQLASSLGCGNEARLIKVLDWIKNGVEIGCRGRFRGPSVQANTKASYSVAPQVTDAVATWVKEGFAYGPVDEGDVPANAKINSILTRPKPNGSVRIILNLSAPMGCSVNDGIDISEFPATMSSTEAWVKVLNKAGKKCWLTKTDWANAYKHLVVAEQDTDLQWFEWGGKYFKELCLIFGGSSSAGIFDVAAKVVLDLVCRQAQFPPDMVCQHLDDVCAAAAADSRAALVRFDEAFKYIARAVGVKLAPRDDPEKSFGPATKGIVFGILYDTVNWTWALPAEKRIRLIGCLRNIMEKDSVEATEAKSITGKLIHIKALVPSGRFNINFIMQLDAKANRADSKRQRVEVSADCKRQLWFWLCMLKTCNEVVSIPRLPAVPQAWALDAYCDAAGGSLEGVGRGTGGVLADWWFYVPWPKRVAAGGWEVDGVKVGRKMAALELVGPLIFVAAGHKLVAGKHLNIWVDNAGSVAIWVKGYSNSCRLSTAIVTAISAICAAIGCTLHIRKIRRCSNTGAILADALSKANFNFFWAFARESQWPVLLEPARLPLPLLAWIDKPTPDMNLADKILVDLAKSNPILGYS